MLLIKCPMCDKSISPNAELCPNCGEPMRKDKPDKLNIYSIILINSGNNPLDVINNIQDITGGNLQEARNTVNNTPAIILRNLNNSQALKYKTLIEKSGAITKIISTNEDYAYNSFIKYTPWVNYDTQIQIKCPNCNSLNTNKIGGFNKAGSVVLFGVFALGKLTKTYQCNKCGYRW